MTHALMSRAQMSSADINDLPDSAFAYIEPGGKKDASGKTVPRELRHFPVHDAAHVRDALARAAQSPFGEKAMAKIRAAAKRFGVNVADPGRAAYPVWLERMYEDSMHPHVAAGSPAGGQFAPKSSGSKGGSGKGGAKKPHAKPARKSLPHGAMAYDPDSNTGPGYGSKNGDDRVHALQQALNRLGVTDGSDKELKDDGKLGPRTTAAVKKAQKALGLTQDGIVTPALLEKITGLKALPARSALLDLCVRSFGFELFEDRAAGGDGRTLEGYAAVFDTPARIRDLQGDFEEVIRRGAFERSLAKRTPLLQWDHGKDPRIGTAPIGDIEDLREDDHGLYVRARLYDHPDIERIRLAVKGRSIKGMSFRFGVPDKGDTWTRRQGEVDLREIRDADVHELGPVAFPAYDATSVHVRSLLAQCDVDERRALIQELAAELRLALDLTDFTGQSDARSDDGGEPGSEPGNGDEPPAPAINYRQRLDEGALRARGILR